LDSEQTAAGRDEPAERDAARQELNVPVSANRQEPGGGELP